MNPARALSHDDSLPTSMPESLGRLGEGGRVEAARPGDEQLRRQRGDAALRLVLARRAGIGQRDGR